MNWITGWSAGGASIAFALSVFEGSLAERSSGDCTVFQQLAAGLRFLTRNSPFFPEPSWRARMNPARFATLSKQVGNNPDDKTCLVQDHSRRSEERRVGKECR